MEDIISHFGKLISNTIMVHVYSHPHFSIEIFLALILCVFHVLLIFEINDVFHETNAKAIAKLRLKHPHLRDSESCSYHTVSRVQVFPQKIETTMRKSYFVPSCRKLTRKISARSNFGWVIPRKDSSLFRQACTDRVDHLLSITPSEYVRKDKERKNRQAGLKSCIQSLTSLLEKALNNEHSDFQNLSKEALRKSINHIKENFENQIIGDVKSCKFPDFGNSLHSLISNSLNRSIKAPSHVVSFNVAEEEQGDKEKLEDRQHVVQKDSEDTVGKGSDFSDYSDDRSVHATHAEQNISIDGI